MVANKFRVYTRMIVFDYSIGANTDVDQRTYLKWGKQSIDVLCNGNNLVDVLSKLQHS